MSFALVILVFLCLAVLCIIWIAVSEVRDELRALTREYERALEKTMRRRVD